MLYLELAQINSRFLQFYWVVSQGVNAGGSPNRNKRNLTNVLLWVIFRRLNQRIFVFFWFGLIVSQFLKELFGRLTHKGTLRRQTRLSLNLLMLHQ